MIIRHVGKDAVLATSHTRPAASRRLVAAPTTLTIRSPRISTFRQYDAIRPLPPQTKRAFVAHTWALPSGCQPQYRPLQRQRCDYSTSVILSSPSTFHRAKRRLGTQCRSRSTNNNGSASKSPVPLEGIKQEILEQKPLATPSTFTKQPAEDHGYLMNRLPDLSHRFQRPRKEDLLAAATGFWSRMRLRFKWFSIRSARPFNLDDISAFATWVVAGHIIWIIVGTTTFFSLVIFAVNTVFAQGTSRTSYAMSRLLTLVAETLAGWIGNYLTKSSGVRVVFESAIVPRWGDGVITFKNVFVSRRPGQHKAKVIKGSQTTAAAAAAAKALAEKADSDEEEDTNYTQYDVSLETVNVTLSFTKWFNGKGLLRDVEVKGVRGVVDRSSVHWNGEYVDPRTYKHEHNTGDFELESFKMDDLLLSVYQPGNFRPYSVSVFSADLPQLRKQYLFYDFLSANHMSGSFDESPFFIHPRQLHNYTGATLDHNPAGSAEPGSWKKQSRIRVDGLNIDHLNRGVDGPFSWIHSGNVDIVADIMFPTENDESIVRVVSDFYDRVEASVASNKYLHPEGRSSHNNNHITTSVSNSTATAASDDQHGCSAPQTSKSQSRNEHLLVMDLRIQLTSVRARIPLIQHSLSYINATLIRPIVAYINSKEAFIPINCRVVKPITDFDGSWTIYDSGLMEETSREVYEAFAQDVRNEQKRGGRIRKVGLWGIGLALQALLLGLAGNVA